VIDLRGLVEQLRGSRGFAHKRDIGAALGTLVSSLPGGSTDLAQAVAVGDDCAAIPDGDGWLLFAIEGFVDDFVQAMPWFAGWSGVMVNLSDIAAMGGRGIAVVDALWSRGGESGQAVLQGLAAAASAYRVPIVGGHTNHRSERNGLAVAVLGRARSLLTSFNARPGDRLLMAVDLRGAFEDPHPFWNATRDAPAERLRGDLELLPELAEAGLADAAKDISMAGVLGTALMLLECSKVGAELDLNAIPRPPCVGADVPLLRWLQAFPSFGFLLSVRPAHAQVVAARFASRGLACADIGAVTPGPEVALHAGAERAVLWDLSAQTFIAPRTEAAHAR
jgi:AIR synthase-related protein